MKRVLCAALLASILPAAGAWAATNAFEEANDFVYVNGWQSGDHGGFGFFGGWLLSEGDGRAYTIGTSTGNGDGDSNGNDDIDTSGRAWSVSSEGAANVATATRRFNGLLDIGQLFATDIDFDPAAGEVVFALQNAAGGDRFRFATSPTIGTRLLDAGELDITSQLPPTDEGLYLQFLMTGLNTYVVVLTPGDGGAPVEFERTLGGLGGIDRLAFSVTADGVQPCEAFLNRLRVPEPTAGAALSAIGSLLVLARRRAA